MARPPLTKLIRRPRQFGKCGVTAYGWVDEDECSVFSARSKNRITCLQCHCPFKSRKIRWRSLLVDAHWDQDNIRIQAALALVRSTATLETLCLGSGTFVGLSAFARGSFVEILKAQAIANLPARQVHKSGSTTDPAARQTRIAEPVSHDASSNVDSLVSAVPERDHHLPRKTRPERLQTLKTHIAQMKEEGSPLSKKGLARRAHNEMGLNLPSARNFIKDLADEEYSEIGFPMRKPRPASTLDSGADVQPPPFERRKGASEPEEIAARYRKAQLGERPFPRLREVSDAIAEMKHVSKMNSRQIAHKFGMSSSVAKWSVANWVSHTYCLQRLTEEVWQLVEEREAMGIKYSIDFLYTKLSHLPPGDQMAVAKEIFSK